MKNLSRISRRRFFRKSALGIGTLGMGAFLPTKLFSNVENLNHPIYPEEKGSPREARVLSVSLEGIEKNMNTVDAMIERISIMYSYRPDIICLPEAFATTVNTAETVPGPIINRFASFAKEHNSYIICSIHTKKNNKIYNSAVLIDRKGEVVGQYDKIHPTEGECDKGTIPGSSPPPVFKTDFGTIGILICFDINWLEDWKSLKEQGAEVVFWSAAYPGGRMLSSYSWIFKYYVVGCSREDPSLIFDITGDMVSKSGRHQHCAFAPLNLEKVFCEIDFHGEKVRAIRKKYGRKVKIIYYHNEDWVTIESCSPDLTINQLINEFDILPHVDYIKRAQRYQDKFR